MGPVASGGGPCHPGSARGSRHTSPDVSGRDTGPCRARRGQQAGRASGRNGCDARRTGGCRAGRVNTRRNADIPSCRPGASNPAGHGPDPARHT